ncbi:hypothetical protein BJ742DRAFT_816931 [Cladochytrium replicatum]|nr:hypothetical protein BJ742DRAFT_816931 [Cladochytrium replicatum]
MGLGCASLLLLPRQSRSSTLKLPRKYTRALSISFTHTPATRLLSVPRHPESGTSNVSLTLRFTSKDTAPSAQHHSYFFATSTLKTLNLNLVSQPIAEDTGDLTVQPVKRTKKSNSVSNHLDLENKSATGDVAVVRRRRSSTKQIHNDATEANTETEAAIVSGKGKGSMSATVKGRMFEEQTAITLRAYGFFLERVGGAGDRGVDLRGEWDAVGMLVGRGRSTATSEDVRHATNLPPNMPPLASKLGDSDIMREARENTRQCGWIEKKGDPFAIPERTELPLGAPAPIDVIVQCKNESSPVGPANVREFTGVLAQEVIARGQGGMVVGVFATRSGFTEAAIEAAMGHRVPPMVLVRIDETGKLTGLVMNRRAEARLRHVEVLGRCEGMVMMEFFGQMLPTRE